LAVFKANPLAKSYCFGELMKAGIRFIAFAAGLLLTQLAAAQATPPAGSTGLCKDGTYSTAASKAGACRGHQGVKEWYAAAPAAKAPAAATAPAPKAATAAPAPAPAPAPAATKAAKASPASKAASMPQAAGGGPGLVWVNTSSNVYHCYGTDFYGKTKAGAYMSEADAKAKGAHPDHGKACSK
jgi:Protein of unknown function (DUF3761)